MENSVILDAVFLEDDFKKTVFDDCPAVVTNCRVFYGQTKKRKSVDFNIKIIVTGEEDCRRFDDYFRRGKKIRIIGNLDYFENEIVAVASSFSITGVNK